jgi:hypothetical protein
VNLNKQTATNKIRKPGNGCSAGRTGLLGHDKIAGMDIYGQANEAEAIATIHRSLELGGNFLDTADLCGCIVYNKIYPTK